MDVKARVLAWDGDKAGVIFWSLMTTLNVVMTFVQPPSGGFDTAISLFALIASAAYMGVYMSRLWGEGASRGGSETGGR